MTGASVVADAFLGLEMIRVPTDVVAEIQAHLAERGRNGFEGVGFWAGRITGRLFQVEAAVIPVQRATSNASGVAVVVDSNELFRLNVWLHRKRLTLIAQVHSHPDLAYHSEADDAYPMVTKVGALSIVVPDFARDPFSLARAAVYRLALGGRWEHLPAASAQRLIHLHNDS